MRKEGTESSRTTTIGISRRRHRIDRRIGLVKELANAIRSHAETLEEDLEATRAGSETNDLKFYEEVEHFEAGLIENALSQTSGHQRRAAYLLGLKASTLSSLIKRYNIPTKDGLLKTSAVPDRARNLPMKRRDVATASKKMPSPKLTTGKRVQ